MAAAGDRRRTSAARLIAPGRGRSSGTSGGDRQRRPRGMVARMQAGAGALLHRVHPMEDVRSDVQPSDDIRPPALYSRPRRWPAPGLFRRSGELSVLAWSDGLGELGGAAAGSVAVGVSSEVVVAAARVLHEAFYQRRLAARPRPGAAGASSSWMACGATSASTRTS